LIFYAAVRLLVMRMGWKKVDHCDPSNQSENYEKFEDKDDKAIEEKSDPVINLAIENENLGSKNNINNNFNYS